MTCKCHWIVLYIVDFRAFCLGGPFFSGHGVFTRMHGKAQCDGCRAVRWMETFTRDMG